MSRYVWLTQAQLTEIYKTSNANIIEHLTNNFNDLESEQYAVVRKIRTTAADDKNYRRTKGRLLHLPIRRGGEHRGIRHRPTDSMAPARQRPCGGKTPLRERGRTIEVQGTSLNIEL